ncbi:ABC transporter permease [Methylobacterium aquaticum]|uniref:ABC transporter permease n=1 Tax=Methylobacterium aquaticum TaxID=270351 RepID=A0A0J6SH11_9HYPH|nr:ABC transporter permease [Methylobacterium aquaticum]KMO34500.1 ABC transporter permease [Methylobacterium aquaticum]
MEASPLPVADAPEGRAAPRLSWRSLPRSSRPPGGRALTGLVLPLVLPLGLALGWEAAVRAGLAQGRLVPPPSRVLATLWGLAESGELWTHVLASLTRVAAGFGFGALAGIAVGALTGTLPLVRRLVDPSLQAVRAIPSIAWVPLFILWFGIFEASKITLIAVGVFFPVYLGVAGAIAGVDRKLVEVGRVFRLSRPALARRILLPAVLPATLVALRTGLGLGFMFVAAAELLGASEGLGYLLLDGQQLGKPDQIVAAILAFAALGKLCDAVLVGLTSPLARWQDTARDTL